MATNSSNYNWTKPSYEDDADIEVISTTIEAIDAQVKANEDNITVNREALAEIINNGPKNKLSWTAADKTHNGITFTVNSNGTVTANGTNDGSANSFISIKIMTAAEIGEFEDFILSGTPENSAGAYISLEERGGSYTTYIRDRGSSATIPAISTEVNVYIVVPKNATVDNMVFSPMICSAAAWAVSHEFQPHRPSYDEIIARITALENA